MSRVTDVLSSEVTEPGHLNTVTIAGSAFGGYELRTADGRLARLVIVDEEGQVLESGPQVAVEAWIIPILAYQRFLEGEGRLSVVSSPGWLHRENQA